MPGADQLLNAHAAAQHGQIGLRWFLLPRGPARARISRPAASSAPAGRRASRHAVSFPAACDRRGCTAARKASACLPGACRADAAGEPGRLKLRSADPRQHPLHAAELPGRGARPRRDARLRPADPRDLRAAGFDRYRGRSCRPVPASPTTRRSTPSSGRKADSAYHPSCTCKMGVDAMAVVDPERRVRGLTACAWSTPGSCPASSRGNLNAPTIMIAEKAADLILGRPPLAAEPCPGLGDAGLASSSDAETTLSNQAAMA